MADWLPSGNVRVPSFCVAAAIDDITWLPLNGPRSLSHAGARRWLLGSCGQTSSNQNTEGDAKKDVVERKAKTHAHGNTRGDGRLTFLAISQVGSRIPSSTHHNTANVDPDYTYRRLTMSGTAGGSMKVAWLRCFVKTPNHQRRY